MEKMSPTPIDKEVKWDTSKTIVSKADLYGTLEYVNDTFSKVSGYDESELVGQPHNIIRHPDMPKVIFKVLWDNIKMGKKFHGIIKNLAKSGEYYWVITDFDYIVSEDAKILKYIARRKAISAGVVEKIEDLYKKLSKIEEVSGIEASEKYLTGYLEDHNLDYVELITKLMMDDLNEQIKLESSSEEIEETKKSFFGRFFGN
ncbi:PAS domain-containing protein [Flavobacterium hydatis]|jgi:PAS domain S-box-containing protein|uniref:Histidine kinase n=1 Tax=Flavobacterium hydatis TaxID=991 RepID=A0A086A0W9_FLAHY|nr:PAS domain-containing protein [Flavobacterium hydatis]KFF10333.1 histidine kinase [Flavobacterium hydatis]OXA92683.1 histidine kinase [Flavobacterium hydatis]